jgi:5-methylcytosine-specific restriction endonuclease McrA
MKLDNPGEQLRELLYETYPLDPNEKVSFIAKIDEAFLSDGELVLTMYVSSINYMTRRLITTAEYLKRKSSGSSDIFVSMLRKYILEQTKIPSNKSEKFVSLLQLCVDARNRPLTQSTKEKIKRNAKNRGARCYICGRDLIYSADIDDGKGARAEVEHVWPHALGGSSDETNLLVACERCNRIKAHFIDANDFHYEEICLVTDEGMESFSTDFHWFYRIAILAKTNYCCVICNQPAQYHGELRFNRRNLSDSWHFLNVDAYCDKHYKERR